MYTLCVMKKVLLLPTLLIFGAFSLQPIVDAQNAKVSASTKSEKKVNDFGLRDRLASEKQIAMLKLTKSQLEKVKKLQSASSKEISVLTEEGKNISHEHAPGEPCPGCAHADKVRKAYAKYYAGLGEILTSPQQLALANLVKKGSENKTSKLN